jgi:hypothetical protein
MLFSCRATVQALLFRVPPLIYSDSGPNSERDTTAQRKRARRNGAEEDVAQCFIYPVARLLVLLATASCLAGARAACL